MGTSLIRRSLWIAVAAALLAVVGPAVAQAKKPKKPAAKTLVVCKHGCRYNTIQKAVNASGPNATINVKPGKYDQKLNHYDLLRMLTDLYGAAPVGAAAQAQGVSGIWK